MEKRGVKNIHQTSNLGKIGLISATIICMNAMIGVGIFTTPAKLAVTVGPAGILTYLFSIVAVLFMALSLARLAKVFPQEGSFYNYAKQWGGHYMGLLAAASYVLGIIIALGLLTRIASQYFHQFIPAISVESFGLIIVGIIALLNIAGMRIMQTGQIILLSCTLFALFSIIALCFSNADYNNLIPFMPHDWTSILESVSAAVFSFLGFESATSLYSIVKNPEKNVSKAIVFSLLIVGLIYLAFIGSIILAIPQNTFTSADMTISQAMIKAFGKSNLILNLTKLISVAILTAICGVLQSVMYSSASLTFSLFKNLDNKFANFIVKSRYGFGIIILIISLLTIFNFFNLKSMGLFFNLTSIFIMFAFIMAILALYFKDNSKKLKDKIIVYLGLITSTLIFVNAIIGFLKEII